MSTEDIIPGITPTRMQLLALKDRRNLAEKGYQLLSEKLEAITSELFSAVVKYREAVSGIRESILETENQINELGLQMGEGAIQRVAVNFPRKFMIKTKQKNLMGVKIPKLSLEKLESGKIPYSIRETTSLFDISIIQFEKTLKDLIMLAEIQSLIQRLAHEISETKRRVNALNYIIIPRLDATINWIQLSLAERERESFVRLKKVKQRLKSKKDEEF